MLFLKSPTSIESSKLVYGLLRHEQAANVMTLPGLDRSTMGRRGNDHHLSKQVRLKRVIVFIGSLLL